MTVETRDVAAYASRNLLLGREPLTHAVDVEADVALCGRVSTLSLADRATTPNVKPTCPVCRARDPRFAKLKAAR